VRYDPALKICYERLLAAGKRKKVPLGRLHAQASLDIQRQRKIRLCLGLDHAYRLIAKTVAQRRWRLRTLLNYSRYGLLAGINADNGARWTGWPP